MNSTTHPERVYSAPAASCAADLLFLLASSPEPLSVAEIARRLDVSKSLVFRVAHVLESKRLLTRVAQNRFWLGLGVLEIGGAYARQVPVADAARQTLRDLAHELTATVTLAVLRETNVFYVMSQEAPGATLHVGFVGNRVPANCTALGKALLAELPWREVRERFAGHYAALTASSISSAAALEEELVRVRELGYATTEGEAIVGRRAMAISLDPLAGIPDRAALAVASNDPGFLDQHARILDALNRAAERLTKLNEVQATFNGPNL